MVDAKASAPTATLTLRFGDAASLTDALKAYSGERGATGLCIQVIKYYELGDLVQLQVEYGQSELDIHGVVAWRKPGYIGVRFEPRSATEHNTLLFLRKLLGDAGATPPSAPQPAQGNKPFAD